MKRLAIVCALFAGTLVWSANSSTLRSRADALFAKAAGSRPEVSWAQTIVSMAPISRRPGIRSVLLKVVESLVAAAVPPGLWSRSLDLPEDPNQALTSHSLFFNPTACMRMLDVHLSILQAGQAAHTIHSHLEEELIFLISGEAEIVRASPDDPLRTTVEKFAPGRVVYHPSRLPHTIRAGSAESARYVVFKWRGERGREPDSALTSRIYDISTAQKRLIDRRQAFDTELIFESPTLYLKRLHVHASRVAPGGGYPDERDPYDLALVLLSGTILTQGHTVVAPSVVYYPADELHDIENIGQKAAEYIIVEFHGHAELDRH